MSTLLIMSLSVAMLFSAAIASSESEVTPKFSNVPTHPETIKEQAAYEKEMQKPVKAWIVKNGISREVAPANFGADGYEKPRIEKPGYGDVGTLGFWQGGYYYIWKKYEPNYRTTDNYRHFVSDVSVRNETTQAIPLKYTQGTTKVNTWQYTGKVEAETSFKVALIGDIKASLGIEVSTTKTTTTSTTVEFGPINAKAGYTTYIEKYYQGAYSGGAGVWGKYYVNPQNQYIYTGEDYRETGNAWGINDNSTHYKVRETRN